MKSITYKVYLCQQCLPIDGDRVKNESLLDGDIGREMQATSVVLRYHSL